MKTSFHSLWSGFAIAAVALTTGCSQQYGIDVAKKVEQAVASIPAPTPNNGGGGAVPVGAIQTFNLGQTLEKQIDLTFVVDNSSSMSDEQQKIADGFAAVAEMYFPRSDLNICSLIITSDRYMGLSNNGYQRERTVGCSKPANYNNMSTAEKQAYTASLIADFKNKVNVGISGSGKELLGKSLVTSLYNLNTINDSLNPNVRNAFYRQNASNAFVFVTDENNWYNAASPAESANDLPDQTNAVIYTSANGLTDPRTGIMNHLNNFFNSLNPGKPLGYKVSTLLSNSQANRAANNFSIEGSLAMNLLNLHTLVGRDSNTADINGSTSVYTNLFTALTQSLVEAASVFTVSHNIASVSSVKILRASGAVVVSSANYTIVNNKEVHLSQAILNSVQAGDQLEVKYSYLP